jgi:hypothetical protein
MADVTILIESPQDGDTLDSPWRVTGTYDGDDVLITCYLDYGYKFGSDNSKFTMDDSGNWTAYFANPPAGNNIKLQAEDGEQNKSQIVTLATVVHQAFEEGKRPKPLRRSGNGGQIIINSPLPGASVTMPFTSSGTISMATTNNVVGTIIAGGQNYQGTTTVEGPNWQVTFSAPASGSNATLQIQCPDQTAVVTQESINIVGSGGSGGAGGGHGHFND